MAFTTGFVAEDGTGLSTATSAVTVADFRAYWTARPLDAGSALTASDSEVQDALMGGTRWLKRRGPFACSPLTSDQALPIPGYWPVIDGRTWPAMPDPLLEAVCIVARYYLDETDTAALDRGGAVKRERIGPIEEEYSDGAPVRPLFAAAEDLVAPFLDPSASGAQMELG